LVMHNRWGDWGSAESAGGCSSQMVERGPCVRPQP
jgi:hypothetical protein